MNLTYKQYKALDVTVFSVIALIAELIVVTAGKVWFPEQLFSVSLFVPLTLIVMMRWNVWAVAPCVLMSVAFCIVSGADSLVQYAVYIVGNAFVLLLLVLFKLFGKEKFAAHWYMTVVYVALGFVFAELGKALVAFTLTGANTLVQSFTRNALSAVLGAIILLIARKQKGLFEDQLQYLRRTNREREAESIRLRQSEFYDSANATISTTVDNSNCDK